MKEVWETLVTMPGLHVLGFIPKGSDRIHLVHSIKKYAEFGATTSLHGSLIGWVGDRDEYGDPSPVRMPPQNSWKYAAVEGVFDKVEIQTFHEDPGNAGKLYHNAAAQTEKIWLPRLLYLPRDLARYCATGDRTALDLAKYATDLAVGHDPPFKLESLDTLLHCCMAWGQCKQYIFYTNQTN